MKPEEKLQAIASIMGSVVEDNAVPRNIRKAVSNAKDRILEKSDDPTVSIASAIYILDEVSNDINMPLHTRTEIWNMISSLEKLKEEVQPK